MKSPPVVSAVVSIALAVLDVVASVAVTVGSACGASPKHPPSPNQAINPSAR